MSIKQRLEALARGRGLQVKMPAPWHFQIIGKHLIVNYYPQSRRRTAYVSGTQEGFHWIDPEQAVEMAMNQPDLTGIKSKRSSPAKV